MQANFPQSYFKNSISLQTLFARIYFFSYLERAQIMRHFHVEIYFEKQISREGA